MIGSINADMYAQAKSKLISQRSPVFFFLEEWFFLVKVTFINIVPSPYTTHARCEAQGVDLKPNSMTRAFQNLESSPEKGLCIWVGFRQKVAAEERNGKKKGEKELCSGNGKFQRNCFSKTGLQTEARFLTTASLWHGANLSVGRAFGASGALGKGTGWNLSLSDSVFTNFWASGKILILPELQCLHP